MNWTQVWNQLVSCLKFLCLENLPFWEFLSSSIELFSGPRGWTFIEGLTLLGISWYAYNPRSRVRAFRCILSVTGASPRCVWFRLHRLQLLAITARNQVWDSVVLTLVSGAVERTVTVLTLYRITSEEIILKSWYQGCCYYQQQETLSSLLSRSFVDCCVSRGCDCLWQFLTPSRECFLLRFP